MKDAPLSVCPECENSALRRLISGGAGVIFKGSGFYVNDSRKASSGGASTKTEKPASEGTSTSSTESTSGKDTAKADSSKKSA
jgi:predicted nucleic acid-binding Zn ribbon protein